MGEACVGGRAERAAGCGPRGERLLQPDPWEPERMEKASDLMVAEYILLPKQQRNEAQSHLLISGAPALTISQNHLASSSPTGYQVL